MYLTAVGDDIGDDRFPSFLNTPETLVFKRRDSAFLVSGRGVFIHDLTVFDKIPFEVFDQGDDPFVNRLVGRPVHQQLLRTEHLGNLGEDPGSAHRRQFITEVSDQGVCGDAGVSVGSSAFEPDDEPIHPHGRPDIVLHFIIQLPDESMGGFKLILHLLSGEELHPLGIHLAEELLEGLGGVVFTAEGEDQNAAGVRVADQARQNGSGRLMVLTELGASEGVGPRIGSLVVFVFGKILLRPLDELFGGHVHAPHRGNDPDLVANADLPIGPFEGLDRRNGVFPALCPPVRLLLERIADIQVIVILIMFAQAGRCVMGVHVFTDCDILGGDTHRRTVFDDRFSLSGHSQCDLVTSTDILEHGHGEIPDDDRFSLFEGMNRYRDGILGADPDRLHDVIHTISCNVAFMPFR